MSTWYHRGMAGYEPDVGALATLIGDPVRARMLFALLDGTEISASELAARAGTSPQSGSGHLRRLVDGELLAVRTVGRQRLFRLASPQIAVAIETLASIAPPRRIVSLSQTNTMRRLRAARTCYDHFAGHLGVALTDVLVQRRAMLLPRRRISVDTSRDTLHQRCRDRSRGVAHAPASLRTGLHGLDRTAPASRRQSRGGPPRSRAP